MTTHPDSLRSGLTDTEKRSLAITLNRDRRHLTQEQKRALASESVKADPQLSDIAHAERVGVSDKTVASVRRDLAARSEIPDMPRRMDSLGRMQPASKPKPDTKSATSECRSLA